VIIQTVKSPIDSHTSRQTDAIEHITTPASAGCWQ